MSKSKNERLKLKLKREAYKRALSKTDAPMTAAEWQSKYSQYLDRYNTSSTHYGMTEKYDFVKFKAVYMARLNASEGKGITMKDIVDGQRRALSDKQQKALIKNMNKLTDTYPELKSIVEDFKKETGYKEDSQYFRKYGKVLEDLIYEQVGSEAFNILYDPNSPD